MKEFAALSLALNAKSVQLSSFDIGIRKLQPVIFFEFIAEDLVAESDILLPLKQFHFDSPNGISVADVEGGLANPNVMVIFGLHVWLPEEHSATAAIPTVLRSIRANDLLLLAAQSYSRSHLGPGDVGLVYGLSPDANYVVVHIGINNLSLITLYHFQPDQSPRFLQVYTNHYIDIDYDPIFRHSFHWTRDSRFCLWGSLGYWQPSFRAFQLTTSSLNATSVVEHKFALSTNKSRDICKLELITSPDGRYFCLFLNLIHPTCIREIDIFVLQTSSSGGPLLISPRLRIQVGFALDSFQHELETGDFAAFDCERGVLYFLYNCDLQIPPYATVRNTVNSFYLPAGFLNCSEMRNLFHRLPRFSQSIPSKQVAYTMKNLELDVNPRGCTWAYERFYTEHRNHLEQDDWRKCARLVRLRPPPATGEHLPTLLQLARAALYERPELLLSHERRGDVPPTLLKTCLSLDPLTYMPRPQFSSTSSVTRL